MSKGPIEPALVSSIGNNLQVPWRDYAPKRSDVRSIMLKAWPVGMAPPPPPEFLPSGIEYQGFAVSGDLAWRVSIVYPLGWIVTATPLRFPLHSERGYVVSKASRVDPGQLSAFKPCTAGSVQGRCAHA